MIASISQQIEPLNSGYAVCLIYFINLFQILLFDNFKPEVPSFLCMYLVGVYDYSHNKTKRNFETSDD
jgi:hypothetical protein